MTPDNKTKNNTALLHAEQNLQAADFSQLSGFQQLFATLFMALLKMFDPNIANNVELNNLFAGIMGFDGADQFKSWHQDTSQKGWEWKGNVDFKKFDFDGARDAVANIKLPNIGDQTLLDVIAKHESTGDYHRVYSRGGIKRVDLTDMTIDEVLDWQKDYVRSGSPSSAAGRYQIINKTLRGLKEELNLKGDELFDEQMQDKMAIALMERRGYSKFLNGEITEQKFMRNLSMEWAGLPKDMGGRSYYAGDGLNKAGATPGEVIAAMRKAKQEPLEKPEQEAVKIAKADTPDVPDTKISAAAIYDSTNDIQSVAPITPKFQQAAADFVGPPEPAHSPQGPSQETTVTAQASNPPSDGLNEQQREAARMWSGGGDAPSV